MRRREFIAGLGGAAAWPVVARAQQRATPLIGFLGSAARATIRPGNWLGFHQGLADAGYIEGRNLAIEYRWADGRNEVLPVLAADLVRQRVAVIASMTTIPCVLAAKAATHTTPIVFLIGGDPVAFGLVASLNRPGGNVTGVTSLVGELIVKRLQMLHEAVPAANPIGLLIDLTNVSNPASQRDVADAASRLGLRLVVVHAARAGDLEAAFAKLKLEGAGALLVSADPQMFTLKNEIAALATRYAIPASYIDRDPILAGGLMSYGPDFFGTARIVGAYIGRILKGEKPADLPVQQSTKLEFVINLKTAKALGLTIPPGQIALADEVIE
jgi:putative ABC transport system substrate-binding protein